jgi:hypothetical protein
LGVTAEAIRRWPDIVVDMKKKLLSSTQVDLKVIETLSSRRDRGFVSSQVSKLRDRCNQQE